MKVEILKEIPCGNASGNLKVGTIHETVDCPKENPHLKKETWVQGIEEPIRILKHEYKIVCDGQ